MERQGTRQGLTGWAAATNWKPSRRCVPGNWMSGSCKRVRTPVWLHQHFESLLCLPCTWRLFLTQKEHLNKQLPADDEFCVVEDTWNQKTRRRNIYTYLKTFFSLSFGNAPRRLSCLVIWLLTFPAMPTCSELPSVENVNAPKWLLINYCGECFTAVTLANTSSGNSSRCFLSAQYIRWLVPTHKHLREEGRGGPLWLETFLGESKKGFVVFIFFFFTVLGWWKYFGMYFCQLLEFMPVFLIKDIFTNTVNVASAKHFAFTAIIHSFQRQFPHGFDVSETKNTFSIHFLYLPSSPSFLIGGGGGGSKYTSSGDDREPRWGAAKTPKNPKQTKQELNIEGEKRSVWQGQGFNHLFCLLFKVHVRWLGHWDLSITGSITSPGWGTWRRQKEQRRAEKNQEEPKRVSERQEELKWSNDWEKVSGLWNIGG